MNLLALRIHTLDRLGENSANPKWWTAAMVDSAINEAQQAFVLLTLCLEKTANFAISSSNYVTPLATAPDWILPVRIRNFVNAKVLPGTIDEFNALNYNWPGELAHPSRYSALGCNLLAFYPRPFLSVTVSITYACSPAELTSNIQVPAIPDEDHPVLAEYALWRCALSAGGADLQIAIGRLQLFLEVAARRAAQVRARNMAQNYDRVPTEITHADISRIIKEMTHEPAGARQFKRDPVAALA